MTQKEIEIYHSKKRKDKFGLIGKKPDPLSQYGFGMVAYKELLFSLALLFGVLSCIMVPAMQYYKSQKGMLSTDSYSQYSLGNFGHTSSQCQIVPYQVMAIPMKCPYGKLTTVQSFGVISANEMRKDICSAQALTTNVCQVATNFGQGIIEKFNSQN